MGGAPTLLVLQQHCNWMTHGQVGKLQYAYTRVEAGVAATPAFAGIAANGRPVPVYQIVLHHKGGVQQENGAQASGVDSEQTWDAVHTRFADHPVLLKTNGNGWVFPGVLKVPRIIECDPLMLEVDLDGQML